MILDAAIEALTEEQILSVGVVDGRNIWKTDFSKAIKLVEDAKAKVGADRIIVATSSSLLHTPVDLNNEKKIDPVIKDWFSFATQKLTEVVTIAKFNILV